MTILHITAPFREFSNHRSLALTVEGGTITDGQSKNGSPRVLTYAEGAVVLAGKTGELLAGPLDIDGAERLAVAVIEGDARVLTSPGIELRLASAVLALIGDLDITSASQEVRHAEA